MRGRVIFGQRNLEKRVLVRYTRKLTMKKKLAVKPKKHPLRRTSVRARALNSKGKSAYVSAPESFMPSHALFKRGEFDFKNLFIFEMANNHQGDVQHGLKIIDELGKISKKMGIRGAIKFQLRDLDTFIHPAHKKGSNNKHVPRFLSTRLSQAEFQKLVDAARDAGLLIMATPFDEKSVDLLEALHIDIVKVASCSALDWPLLERIAETNRPVIVSTAGVALHDVDRVVAFFQHRGVPFALMHCVALYPTPSEKLNLGRIEMFAKRYPDVPVGYSTHEDPKDTNAVRVAYAKGARIFEKHVALPTDQYSVNKYSATPVQLIKWIEAWQETAAMLSGDSTMTAGPEETQSLRELMRGVFVKKAVKKGGALSRNNIYFAMPASSGQLVSGEWKESMVADRSYKAHEAVSADVINSYRVSKNELVASFVRRIKGMLAEANIAVGAAPEVELSHHYGRERFLEYGTAIISCINREYCKKVLLQLPNQYHPAHYHKKKEESFQVLSGELVVELEKKRKILYPGDVLVVPRGTWHSFWTDTGAIFEEVSTTHFNDDSFYADKTINKVPRDERKTQLVNWGRHQFDNEQ